MQGIYAASFRSAQHSQDEKLHPLGRQIFQETTARHEVNADTHARAPILPSACGALTPCPTLRQWPVCCSARGIPLRTTGIAVTFAQPFNRSSSGAPVRQRRCLRASSMRMAVPEEERPVWFVMIRRGAGSNQRGAANSVSGRPATLGTP